MEVTTMPCLQEFLLFPPDVVMLSGDTEFFSEAEVSERPTESEEEASTEEEEENSQTEQCEQGMV